MVTGAATDKLVINPYAPGAGRMPQYIAGRSDIINEANKNIIYVESGYPTRSVIYYGLRGVGKTVLLNTIEGFAVQSKVPYEYIEVSERGSFKSSIIIATNKLMRKLSLQEKAKQYIDNALGVLNAFQITYTQEGGIEIGLDKDISSAVGTADTGNFQNDLTELFLALGMLAQKAGKGVVFFIDEVQYLKDDEFEALIAAVHRANQRSLPLVVFGAGLPKIAKIAGDIKSYAERLFYFIEIDSLDEEAARLALERPASQLGVTFERAALDKIIEITEGYPYFLQEYGQQVWNHISNGKISLEAVEKSEPDFWKALDESFFKVRHDRATQKELEFMIAMVKCAELPCSTNEIAEKMGRNAASVSPLRAQLIHKGFIYATNRGEVDFTVPQFDKYLKRIYNI